MVSEQDSREIVARLTLQLRASSSSVAPCARRLVASSVVPVSQGRGTAHMLSLGLGAAPAFGGAGADKIALHVR